MMYAIKVKSEEKRGSLLEELESSGWSWQSGHNTTSKIMGLASIVDRYLVLNTDSYSISVSSKEGLKKDCVKIKNLSCIPQPMSFVIKSESKKQFKSILRHLAVRGYRWINGKELLKDFNSGESWKEVDRTTWICVLRSSKEVHWTQEQSLMEEWECSKSVDIGVFDLPFVEDENIQIRFTCWKTFKKALKILEKEDFLWVTGKKPTEWVCDDWSKENFSVKLIIWEKRSNGDSKRISWDY